MTTYLFTWNPARWDWTYLEDSIAEIQLNGYCSETWSCGVTKKIHTGDRAFLMKQGQEPRGIIASGWVASDVFEDTHWDEDRRTEGKIALYVDVDWDTLLDPSVEVFPHAWLDGGIYSGMHWQPQASGVRIPDDIADQLERDWARFLNRSVVIRETPLAEEVDATATYAEGTTRQITINVYERNAAARTMCINHYGSDCFVCGFNFERTYGEMGAGFIHVHHLQPLSEIGQEYELNPIQDLRPVCPNCHAMIHQRRPAYSVDELRAVLRQK